MAIDPGGNLFITDNHGERIRKVSPAGIITTVAGTGQIGYTADGGPATAARLDSPTAICVDRRGNLYFGEGLRYVITALNGVPALKTVTNGNMVVREVIGVAVPQ